MSTTHILNEEIQQQGQSQEVKKGFKGRTNCWLLIHWRSIVLYVSPLLFLPLLFLYENPESKCAYVLFLMTTYWISEALPIGVTGFLPIVFFPCFKILTSHEVSIEYLCDSNIEYLGGLLLAHAFAASGLDQLIAFRILLAVGNKPTHITYGILFTTLLMAFNNGSVGAVAIMRPIIKSLLDELDIKVISASTLGDKEIFDETRNEEEFKENWIEKSVENVEKIMKEKKREKKVTKINRASKSRVSIIDTKTNLRPHEILQQQLYNIQSSNSAGRKKSRASIMIPTTTTTDVEETNTSTSKRNSKNNGNVKEEQNAEKKKTSELKSSQDKTARTSKTGKASTLRSSLHAEFVSKAPRVSENKTKTTSKNAKTAESAKNKNNINVEPVAGSSGYKETKNEKTSADKGLLANGKLEDTKEKNNTQSNVENKLNIPEGVINDIPVVRTTSSRFSLDDSVSTFGTLSGEIDEDEDDGTDEFNKSFATTLFLATAFAANIGCSGSNVGTSTNHVLQNTLDGLFGARIHKLNFSTWFLCSFPLMIVNTAITGLFLNEYFLRERENNRGYKHVRSTIRNDKLRRRYDCLPNMTFGGYVITFFFITSQLFWFMEDPPLIPGWANYISLEYLSRTTITMGISILLCIFPKHLTEVKSVFSGKGSKDIREGSIIDWDESSKDLEFGVIFLMGGGFALVKAMEASKLTCLIQEKLPDLIHDICFLPFFSILTVSLVSEFITSVPIVAVVFPLFMKYALEKRMNPLLVAFPPGLALSYTFLPIGNPSIALIVEKAYIPKLTLFTAGLIVKVYCTIMLIFFTYLWFDIFLNLRDFPTWAQQALNNTGTFLTDVCENYTFSS